MKQKTLYSLFYRIERENSFYKLWTILSFLMNVYRHTSYIEILYLRLSSKKYLFKILHTFDTKFCVVIDNCSNLKLFMFLSWFTSLRFKKYLDTIQNFMTTMMQTSFVVLYMFRCTLAKRERASYTCCTRCRIAIVAWGTTVIQGLSVTFYSWIYSDYSSYPH